MGSLEIPFYSVLAKAVSWGILKPFFSVLLLISFFWPVSGISPKFAPLPVFAVTSNDASFECGFDQVATTCSDCTAGNVCRSIEQAVDSDLATDWDPSGLNVAYTIQFEYSVDVAPQLFYIVTPSGDTLHDRSQWTILASNVSGQYSYSFPTFTTILGVSPKVLVLSSIYQPVYFKYWMVRTEAEMYQLVVSEMYFAVLNCSAGYFALNTSDCRLCQAGSYSTGFITGAACPGCSAGTYAANTGENVYVRCMEESG